ncbi:MAG: DegT/DnrJ/EryC1/StrS aminotransferase family protein [Deltaproteobacteria bacterium]|jgi:dTDP-4-amino-4,6-dideoxygalactose transaminase|nr:DegT/DnrJ/EryC1/StrS aminotransferase family protein [Deltaproteobacteria bacterium]
MGLAPLPEFLPFAPPLTGPEEVAEIADTLKSGWLTKGPKSERFEKDLAAYLGAPDSLAVSSGTAALHLALAALGVTEGQGVITTPLTFASTVHAIVYQRATPFLVDIDPLTGNLDPQLTGDFLKNKCRKGPNGRPIHKLTGVTVSALLPVHYGGLPADLKAFWEIAETYNLNLVEDAAHALGSYYGSYLIGDPSLRPPKAPFGLTAFSFYATKNLATGEGGLLTATEPEILAKARVLSAYGISDARKIWGRYAPQGTWVYDVADLGFKYNFTDIQAALGLAQLKKLPEFLAARKERANVWLEALRPLEDLVILPQEPKGTRSSWHLFPLRLNLDRLKIDRDAFITRLKELNIGVSVMFIPIHFHSYYQRSLLYPVGSLPQAEKFFSEEISLPLSPAAPLALIQEAAYLTRSLIESCAR